MYYSQLDLYDKLWFITGHPLILLLLHRYPQERRHKSTSIVILSDFLSLSACVASSLDNTSSCISAWRRVEIKGDSIVSGDWWCENVKLWNCEIVVFPSKNEKVKRWKGENVKLWNRGVFVKTWKGENVKMWKCEIVKLWNRGVFVKRTKTNKGES